MSSSAQTLGRPFLTVWVGQTISEVGTMLSGIAAAVYIFLETGSATWLGVVSAITALPVILVGAAGSILDRYPRRQVMIAADIVAALSPTIALTLALTGRLQVWHLIVAGLVASAGNAAQSAASQAAIPALVHPDQLDRAQSLKQLGAGIGVVIGPIAATPILVRWGIEAVLIVDLVTFAVGIAAVLLVRFADPPQTAEVDDDGSSSAMWSWLGGPGRLVFTLILVAAVLNLTLAFFNIAILVAVTLVAGAAKVGLVLGFGGVAMIAGSIVSALLGRSSDRLARVSMALVAVGTGFIIAGIRPSVWFQAAGVGIALAAVPAVGATLAAIFNERVPSQMQGRVFALRASLAQVLQSVGSLIAGFVIVYVADPAMRSNAFADSIGRVIGSGPASGASLILIATGVSCGAIGTWLLRSSLRHDLCETDLSERDLFETDLSETDLSEMPCGAPLPNPVHDPVRAA